MSIWVLGITMIVFYLVIILAIGILSGRSGVESMDDFAVTTSGFGIFVLLFTVAATLQSAFAYMGYSGWLYGDGIGAMLDTAGVVFIAIFYWYIGRRLWILNRRFGYLSLVDFSRNFYGGKVIEVLVLLVSILFTLPYIGLQLAGAGYLFNILTDGRISFEIGSLVLLIVIVFYTMLGGMRAVAWTDAFQGIFFFALFLIGGYFVVKNAFGGMGNAFGRAFETNPELLTLPGPSGSMTSVGYFSQYWVYVLGVLFAPQVIIRIFSARSINILKWSTVGTALFTVIMVVFVPAYSLGGHSIFPNLAEPDRVFPMLLLEYAPTLIAVLALTAAFAAMMSTADSQLHAVSVMITTDFYQKYINKNPTDKQLYTMSRWFIVVIGAIGYIILLVEPPFLVKIFFLALGGFALLAPTVVGALYWKRANSYSAIASIVIGFSLHISFTYFFEPPLQMDPGFIGLFIGTLAYILIGFIVGKPSRKEIINSHQVSLNKILESRL